jgi:hypothetical protein
MPSKPMFAQNVSKDTKQNRKNLGKKKKFCRTFFFWRQRNLSFPRMPKYDGTFVTREKHFVSK